MKPSFVTVKQRSGLMGSVEAPMGFTGHYRHSASGLHLAFYRAYDAELGRWLNRDPIEEEGGLNLYGYVENNPGNDIDPTGENPLWRKLLQKLLPKIFPKKAPPKTAPQQPFPKPKAPIQKAVNDSFDKKCPDAAAKRDSVPQSERDEWVKHYDDVPDRTKSDPGSKLNRERAKWLRGERDEPPGNIHDYE